jgi:hypothetical protein
LSHLCLCSVRSANVRHGSPVALLMLNKDDQDRSHTRIQTTPCNMPDCLNVQTLPGAANPTPRATATRSWPGHEGIQLEASCRQQISTHFAYPHNDATCPQGLFGLVSCRPALPTLPAARPLPDQLAALTPPAALPPTALPSPRRRPRRVPLLLLPPPPPAAGA